MEIGKMKQKAKELIKSFLPYVHQGGMLYMTEQEREYDNAKDATILHLEKQIEQLEEIQGDSNYLSVQIEYLNNLIEEVKNLEALWKQLN